jgi:Do/DeqQ family serine protease
MKRLLTPLILIVFLTAGGGYASAAIPPVVDGQPVPSLAPMLQKVIPGVVNIASEGRVQVSDPFFDDPMLRKFFGLPDTPRSERTQSLGSGVILDARKGYILTNNHVIEHADKITVKLNDGRTYQAKLIGADSESDVAVIQIPAENLVAVPIGDSDKLRVGDFVVAIGSPFGLGQTVTSGIVSALGRSGLGIEGYEDFIQTDASINPGNSGGALVNLRGQLVGINTAILSRSGGNIGIGFAIPINMADTVMQQLITHGEVQRGQLGVNIQDLTPQLAQAFNIQARQGAVVTRVTPGSAAEKAGVQSGDVIVGVDGQPIRDALHLRNTIGLLTVGQKIKLEILRDGTLRTVQAVIGEAPEQNTKVDAEKLHPRLAGCTFGNIDDNSPLHGRIQGVQVLECQPGSPAWQAGLRQNDVIVSANRAPVSNLNDLRQAVKGSQSLLLNIRRGNGALFLFLQ